MGYQGDELQDTWADLVPEQPKGRDRWVLWLVGAAAVFLVACICVTGSYFAFRQFLVTPTPVPPPVIPTEPGSQLPVEPTVVPEDGTIGEGATAPAPTPPVFPTEPIAPAPTVIVPTEETAPPPVVGEVTAVRLASAPIIDGLLDEWAAVPATTSDFLVYQFAGWDGTDDLTASWRLAWDPNNLYLGVEVTDNMHVQTQSGNQIFRGDSVDMQFDTDRQGDFGTGLSPDDYQITFSPGNFATLPASAFRFQGTTGGQILDAPGGHHVSLAALKTAAGYTLEAAVPWSDLGLAPVEGMVIGLALNANDNDSPNSAIQEVMKSHIASRTLTDPSGWGTLILR